MVGYPATQLSAPRGCPGCQSAARSVLGVLSNAHQLDPRGFGAIPDRAQDRGWTGEPTGVTKLNTTYPSEVVERAQAVDVCYRH
jgi:hypothetical protein